MYMKRNEVSTPAGVFPIPEGIYESNTRATDMELLESLYVYGDCVDPFVFRELIYRRVITGFETQSQIEAIIEEKKTGKKSEHPKKPSIRDLVNRSAQSWMTGTTQK